jgi:hypothetical protein
MGTIEQLDQWQRYALQRLSLGGFKMYAPGGNLKSLERLGLVSLTRLSDHTSLTAVELTDRGRAVVAGTHK